MQDWDDGRETEAEKHACSKWSPKRRPELWVHGYSGAAHTNGRDLRPAVQKSFVTGLRSIHTYHSPVDSLQHRLAIESIVHTRDETSRNENDDAQVIDLIPPLIDLRL